MEGQTMSEFQDKQLTCVDCGGTFLWSTKEQAFFRDRGYSEPGRCQMCRQAKKERQLHDRGKGGKK